MHEHDDANLSGRRFFNVTVLNALITLVEIVGGVLSGSLALLSDAFHNLGDTLSIVLSYVAHRISLKPETPQNSYGFKRAQILSALLNAALLIVISVFLVYEAIKRLSNPQPIDGGLMLIVAIISLITNAASTLLMLRGSKHNLNMRATYLHLLSDTLSSVGVIIGGILVLFFHFTLVDPIITVIVAIYIIWESVPIIRETISILMQATPPLDYKAICHDIRSVPGVTGVHHIHAWSVDENNVIFSAHVNMHDMKLSEVEVIYRAIEAVLKEHYTISHVTIQAEVHRGQDENIFHNEGDDISKKPSQPHNRGNKP